MIWLHKLLDFLAYWWHQATTSRYVLHLERENKRLLAENTALHATIHGLHGIPGRAQIQPAAADPGPLPMALREAVRAINQADKTGAKSPVVVRSSTRPSARREAEREGWKKHNDNVREKLVDLQNQLNDEIKAEQEARKGTGFVVTQPGAEPVQVHEPAEPIVELEEAQEA